MCETLDGKGHIMSVFANLRANDKPSAFLYDINGPHYIILFLGSMQADAAGSRNKEFG